MVKKDQLNIKQQKYVIRAGNKDIEIGKIIF